MPDMSQNDAEERLIEGLRQHAVQLGFSRFGVAPAVSPPGLARLDEWLGSGYAGQMHYLADRRDAYEHPGRLLEGAKSVIVLTLDYRTEQPQAAGAGQGRVSRYAWGTADYHDLIRPRLHQLADTIREAAPGAETRCVVDTAPIMEREFAVLAGLGWIGKNTLLLSKEGGSYFFLAAIITTADLPIDTPLGADHCGSCTACLDACPTDAFVEAGVLDASRCISYFTIESPELPPVDLRSGVGEWLFGCDVCQEVCPWNSKSVESREPAFSPIEGTNPVDLIPLFELGDAAFRARFKQTPLWRPRRRGLLRNAAIVLGNSLPEKGVAALVRGLNDSEPLVRAASAWALGCYGGTDGAICALEQRAAIEDDPQVAAEIDAAINSSPPLGGGARGGGSPGTRVSHRPLAPPPKSGEGDRNVPSREA